MSPIRVECKDNLQEKQSYSLKALVSYTQREGMGLLEYQAMPSLRDVAHDGGLCTFSNISGPDRGKWCGPSGQAA